LKLIHHELNFAVPVRLDLPAIEVGGSDGFTKEPRADLDQKRLKTVTDVNLAKAARIRSLSVGLGVIVKGEHRIKRSSRLDSYA
jgi:hypothetical protein